MNEDSGDTANGSVNTNVDSEKEPGEAFELSQLLFVVGHIIKRIVFLRLVECEWKWQKK